MKKTKWIMGLLATVSMVWGAHAQQKIDPPADVFGKVEQWAPAAYVIKVGGVTYKLSKDVQVIDRNTALLTSNAVRSGGQVQLLVSAGEVSHVVVNPGSGVLMDRPQQ